MGRRRALTMQKIANACNKPLPRHLPVWLVKAGLKSPNGRGKNHQPGRRSTSGATGQCSEQSTVKRKEFVTRCAKPRETSSYFASANRLRSKQAASVRMGMCSIRAVNWHA